MRRCCKSCLLASLLAGAALCGVMTSDTFAAEAYQEAGFEDEDLYACVIRQYKASFPEEAEGITENTVLTDEQLEKMKVLVCRNPSPHDIYHEHENHYETIVDAESGVGVGVESLEGIEKMTGLEVLDIANHGVGKANDSTNWSLDLSDFSDLKYAYVQNNHLISLEIPRGTLIYLYASGNELTELDLEGQDKMELLEVSWNHLAALDVSDCTELLALSSSYNDELESIDVSNNKKLGGLGLVGTAVTEVDVSNQPYLGELFAPEDTMVKPYPDYKINDECELTLGLKYVGEYNTIGETEHYFFNDESHLLTIESLPVNNIVQTSAFDGITIYPGHSSVEYKLDLGNELTTEFKKTKDCVPKSSEESDIKVPDTGGSVTGEQNAHIMEISLVALGVVAALGFIGNYVRDRLQHRVKF